MNVKPYFKFKRGSAVALCLVFATVLLMMGLAYSKLTSTSKKQTIQIDERIKLEYLAHGITELALLKFQLYPADFYACIEASQKGESAYLSAYTTGASEFSFSGKNAEKRSVSSFNSNSIDLQLASMTIITNSKWKNEVLYIEAFATYEDQFHKKIDKVVSRLVDLNRKSLIPGR